MRQGNTLLISQDFWLCYCWLRKAFTSAISPLFHFSSSWAIFPWNAVLIRLTSWVFVTETQFPMHFGKLHSLNEEGFTFSASIPTVNVNGSFHWEQALTPASCARPGGGRRNSLPQSLHTCQQCQRNASLFLCLLMGFVFSPLQYVTKLVLNVHLHNSSSSLKWK